MEAIRALAAGATTTIGTALFGETVWCADTDAIQADAGGTLGAGATASSAAITAAGLGSDGCVAAGDAGRLTVAVREADVLFGAGTAGSATTV